MKVTKEYNGKNYPCTWTAWSADGSRLDGSMPLFTPAAARRHGEEQIILEGMSDERALSRILSNA